MNLPITPLLWLNGRLEPMATARIDPADRGWTLGDGVFETLYCAAGSVAHLAAHLARLAEGARVLDLPPLPAENELAAAVAATLAANHLECGPAVVRLTATRGIAARGLLPPAQPQPTLMITTTAAPPLSAEPISAVIATVTRRNELSPLSRIKSLNYLDGILAKIEARDRGAEEAILLNTRGLVAETTIANLLAVIDGRLVTPPVSDGALPGIIRRVLLEHAEAIEAPLTVAELLRADEVMVCNSLGLRPVVAIDRQPVGGSGTPGPVFARLTATGLLTG
ncbi:putative branched-chain-amino-acid aminotransferase [uncultured Gammaproteobacteria bacterium]